MLGADFLSARNAGRLSATDMQPLAWSVFIFFMLVLLQLSLPMIGQFLVAISWSFKMAWSGISQQEMMKTLLADPAFTKALAVATFVSLTPTSIFTAWLAYRAAGWRGGDRRKAMALNMPDLGWLGWTVVVVGVVIVVGGLTVLIRYLSGNLENTGEVEKIVQMLSTDYLAMLFVVLAIGLFGPVAEEFMFRGPIFSRLLATPLASSGTVLLTGLLFSLMHVSYFAQGIKAGLVALVPLFFMGLVLGWLRVKFGSIWVPIVCHCVWNLLTCVALFNASLPGAV
jgi:membrane protease YdiL (CAAX protease family)